MTFQEAYDIIMTEQADQADTKQAIDLMNWYKDNVLELEDYETDKLYKALDRIKKRNEWNTYISDGKLIIEPHSEEIEAIINTDDFKNYVSEAVGRYTNCYSGGFEHETDKD